MDTVAPLTGPSELVERELLDLFARRSWRVPLAVMFAAVLIATLAWGKAPHGLTLGWVLAVALTLALRAAVLWRLPHLERWSLKLRLRLVMLMYGLSGVAYAGSFALWPYLGDLERAVQSMFVLAVCAGGVVAQVGYLPVFTAYLLPLFLTMGVYWVEILATPGKPWWRGAAGVMALLLSTYGVLMLALARDTYRLYLQNFDTRRELSVALERAEAANRAKTRFLASASHDLRQPMHTLTLFSAALSMRPLDERTRLIAQQMNTALQALGTQLDALLDVSKLDAGVVAVKPVAFPLAQLLRRVADELEPLARRKGLQLVVGALPAEDGFTDPVLLERVLRNLLDNALKYTVQGSVRLDLRSTATGLVLAIADTGPGIPPDERERVFEEFYQLGNAERDHRQGLGLGLSIVRRLAGLLQLDLAMRSELGQGTEFTLHIPRASEAPASAARATAAEAEAPAVRGLHVLVVDDEDSVRQGMRTLLEGMGCQVSIATGTAALAEDLAAGRPDIVLADFRLRGDDDGIAAVRCARQRWPGVAALLISGDTAPARLREADAAGLRLLHKPVAVDQLMRAIVEEVTRDTDAAPAHVSAA
ncbi:hybrid sensor histidine kinase/response regulator [Azohydromonas australica]|uniref:hybrid sensor histidine kinase/response regulator n=1 Tax=Azohydromonas australica TaxID=364039 RepID=UPI00040962E5|nr:hybrid sensor histidine kinase/response regulator [Azohydromonas australica]